MPSGYSTHYLLHRIHNYAHAAAQNATLKKQSTATSALWLQAANINLGRSQRTPVKAGCSTRTWSTKSCVTSVQRRASWLSAVRHALRAVSMAASSVSSRGCKPCRRVNRRVREVAFCATSLLYLQQRQTCKSAFKLPSLDCNPLLHVGHYDSRFCPREQCSWQNMKGAVPIMLYCLYGVACHIGGHQLACKQGPSLWLAAATCMTCMPQTHPAKAILNMQHSIALYFT